MDIAGRSESDVESGGQRAGPAAASAPGARGTEAGGNPGNCVDADGASPAGPALASAPDSRAGSAAGQAACGDASSAGEAGPAENGRVSLASCAAAEAPPNAWHALRTDAQEGAWVAAQATGSVSVQIVQRGAEGRQPDAAGCSQRSKEAAVGRLERPALVSMPRAGEAAVAEVAEDAAGPAADAREGAGGDGTQGHAAAAHEGPGPAGDAPRPKASDGRAAGPAEGPGGGPGSAEALEEAHGLEQLPLGHVTAADGRGAGAAAAVGAALLPAPHWRRLDDLLRESGFAGLAPAPQVWLVRPTLKTLPQAHLLSGALLEIYFILTAPNPHCVIVSFSPVE